MRHIINSICEKLHIAHWQFIAFFLVLYDIIIVNVSYLFALWNRFECHVDSIPEQYMQPYLRFAPFYTVFCVLLFMALGMYKMMWRFASYSELFKITISSVVSTLFIIIGMSMAFGRMPISFYVYGAILQYVMIVAIRFSYRFVLLETSRRSIVSKSCRHDHEHINRVMIVGAGSAGRLIISDINHTSMTTDHVVCVIDDNRNKIGRYIDGVPIVGNRHDIIDKAIEYKIDKIYITLPNSRIEDKREIINICKETGCELKNLPGMYQLVNGEVNVSFMKNVKIEDLLGRDSIQVDLDEIFHYLQGKTIMVTGGGGSIGSELCRQIAKHSPKMLVLFDVYENSAYDIEQELRTDFPGLNLKVLIGSIRDSRRILQVFEEYRPDVVYHAAAHKHVPLMEDSPCEAIKNNAIGTYKTAYAAMMYGCSRFVMISTDKAVNPTNIMGASKRLCEMIVQTFDRLVKEGRTNIIPPLYEHAEQIFGDEKTSPIGIIEKSKTEFVAVRFGNVLGSNGSVVPLFKKQIANGGPVTVTHPDIIRYFMTIPEAVSLVLQAGVYAHGGEIFVLDMGEPVKIDTLARNLIKLSGFKPDVDIKIEYTGLRPGEKLYEEKLMAEEGMKTTPNKQIHIGAPIEFDPDKFLHDIKELMDASYNNRSDIDELVKSIVTTYHPKIN